MDYKTLSSLWQQGQAGLAPEQQDNFGTVTLPDGTQIQRTGDSYNLIKPGSRIGSQYQQYGSDGSVQNLISKHSTGLLDRIGDTLPVVVPAMIGSMTAAGLMGGFSPASGWVSAEGGAGYAGGLAADAGGLWGSKLASMGLNKAIGTGLNAAMGAGGVRPAANGNTGITGGGMASTDGFDWGSLFNTGLDLVGGNYLANNVADVANTSADNIKTLAGSLADKGKFTPYNITSSVGSVTSGPNGITTTLSPQMQAIQGGAFGRVADLMTPYTNQNVSDISGQAYDKSKYWLNKQVNPLYAANEQKGLFGAGQLMDKASAFDPEAEAKKQYDLTAALYAPGQEQDNLNMENRLLSQGRLGLSYGSVGAAPELAALKQAQLMQNLQNSLSSRDTAFKRQDDLISQAGALNNIGIQSGKAGTDQQKAYYDMANGLFGMGMKGDQFINDMNASRLQQANTAMGIGMTPTQQMNTQVNQSLSAGQNQASAEQAQAQLQARLGLAAEDTRYKGAALGAAIKNGMIGSAITGAKGFLNGSGAANGVGSLVQSLLKSGVNPSQISDLLSQSGIDYGDYVDNFDMGGLEDWANNAGGDWAGAGDMDWDWF